MRTSLLLSLVSLVSLAACGEERPAAAPALDESAAPATRPGEDAILARWDAAQAEITRLEAEQERSGDEAPAEGDRRLPLRRAIELDHRIALAVLDRERAEVDFLALACPERARAIAESFATLAQEERAARERWLPVRLEQVDANVALTDVVEDDAANDATIDRATERAEDARARAEELQGDMRDSRDRGIDRLMEARDACEESLPAGRG